jgi:hypothetical protein
MFIGSQLGMMASAAFYPLAADFDGTNDYMRLGAGLTGAVGGKFGTFSGWVRLDGGDNTLLSILSFNEATINRATNVDPYAFSNSFILKLLNSGGAGVYYFGTTASYTTNAAWRHILASWDTTGGGTSHLYINNVSDKSVRYGSTGQDVGYVFPFAVGTEAGSAGTSNFNGGMAEIWFNPTFLDLSVASNRAKFIDPTTLKPVDLGANGSTPLGSQPIVYQSLRSGDAVTAFATNRGTGGNLTITGTLDLITPSPWA